MTSDYFRKNFALLFSVSTYVYDAVLLGPSSTEGSLPQSKVRGNHSSIISSFVGVRGTNNIMYGVIDTKHTSTKCLFFIFFHFSSMLADLGDIILDLSRAVRQSDSSEVTSDYFRKNSALLFKGGVVVI